ncbi:hypothetical protein mru_2065 [Methanobrevibacter ruminantium M1]|uniref:Uncharacterized protein n=1 Tax=Methanobrevibacter ruminantium (strain ATCC 35063 / DSM 1093 / JCM 13430 / OCM 146 / M1) TaxID=634498 RepID=D3E0U1_METRM|nr:hypothetical protein [Methanobrevibacter ruminantium]ADC47915.1 hypothetical protein mru_2065 [Methanobrevibacter ruminantium M1]
MDNSNIIISVIIVLCIAAGVTAYGISEGDNAVFSDLTGFSPSSTDSGDTGIGNTTGNNSQGGGITAGQTNVATNTGGSSSGGSSGSGSSGSGSGSGSGSSGSGGSSSGNGGGNTNPSPSPSKISAAQAKNIAAGAIAEEGAYISSVSDTGSAYVCYISNAEGTNVGYITVSYGGAIIEGAGGAP